MGSVGVNRELERLSTLTMSIEWGLLAPFVGFSVLTATPDSSVGSRAQNELSSLRITSSVLPPPEH